MNVNVTKDMNPVMTVDLEEVVVQFVELASKKRPVLQLQAEDKAYLLYDECEGSLSGSVRRSAASLLTFVRTGAVA